MVQQQPVQQDVYRRCKRLLFQPPVSAASALARPQEDAYRHLLFSWRRARSALCRRQCAQSGRSSQMESSCASAFAMAQRVVQCRCCGLCCYRCAHLLPSPIVGTVDGGQTSLSQNHREDHAYRYVCTCRGQIPPDTVTAFESIREQLRASGSI